MIWSLPSENSALITKVPLALNCFQHQKPLFYKIRPTQNLISFVETLWRSPV